MATAFPIYDEVDSSQEDRRSHRTPIAEHIVDEASKQPLRIFFDNDDDDHAQSSHDRPRGRSRGNQSRGRGRNRGRGRGDNYRDESGDRRSVNENNENTMSYRGSSRGRRNSRGGPRGNRGRYPSSARSSSQKRDSNSEGFASDTHTRSESSHRQRERGKGFDRGRERRPRSVDVREGSASIEPSIHRGTDTAPTPRKLYLKKLIELSKAHEDADDLLMEIASVKSGFAEVLDSEIKPDWLFYILKILCIAITSSKKRTMIEVLVQVEKHFLGRLSGVLGELSAKTMSHQKIWGNSKVLSSICIMILQILKELVQTITMSLGKSKNVLINVKEIVLEFGLGDEHMTLQTEIKALEEVFRAVVKEREEREIQNRTHKRQQHAQRDEEGLPPEDFRELNVLPRLRDVQMDEKPFLRANRTKGKYDDLDQYLDIQFRLLREDFIQPLRSGITEYIHSISEGGSDRKIRDIRLYKNVQIVRPVCTSDGISYIIQFDTSAFKRMNWSTSQRLKYGSLLCLSNDDFQTISYATVKDRNVSDLSEGYVRVHFESMPSTEKSETFLMAESTAYFEAFRHVLEGLQSVDESLPFQKYLIECNSLAIKPPQYLLKAGVALYDFGSIISQNRKGYSSTEVPVLNTTRWPTAGELELDASQYAALQQAVTKEVAVIQGPPGTGKTFIGLKIAQILIENQIYWKPEKKGSPILVVCFTNHALDQFLEGMMTFCGTGIVRVGGRCSNTSLERFILRNLKREKTKQRTRNYDIYQNERDCLREMSACQREIHRISAELKKTYTEIISFERLRDQMTEDQQEYFEADLDKVEKRHYIDRWLGLQIHDTSDEEGDSRDTLPSEEHAKKLWSDHLMKQVEEMAVADAILISDPISITLLERAQLYKAWSKEFAHEIEKVKHSVDEGMKKDLAYLASLSLKSKSEIIHPNKMLQFVQSAPTKSQINTLLKSTKFESWLAVDGSSTSAKAIQDLIENLDNVKETEIEDTQTEDRELDSDEDEFLFDYADDDLRRGGRKHSNPKEAGGNWLLKWDAKIEREKVQSILRNAEDLSERDANRVYNVLRIKVQQRRNLYKFWIIKYRVSLKASVAESTRRFNELTERLKEVRESETMQILQQADIIGMTTTGAAKHRQALQKVKPSIVIVEEAAEVLESHIITALSDGCKHLILIGDHKQLRPSTTVYELATRYKLDISLFERLIKNGIPCITLSEQHRMRPEISCMLKNDSLYPRLEDHEMVLQYDHIRGIDADVFFIEHNVDEVRVQDSTSYQNPHEAKFLAGLCKYLLQQGYERTQITILSPYMGQVSLLRKEMPKSEFEGVRITAVDNFQGEENDIILLSLVRSRSEDLYMKKNPIGFLGIPNRICVALSRAKMGFFVSGNFSHIKDHSKLWQFIVGKMTESRQIGKAITLRCQNHPQKVIKASTYNDFKQAPDGGCKEPCGQRLNCSHFCPRVCHIVDREHKYIKCQKQCVKIFDECGHRCLKKCWEKCGRCETKVIKKLPMCVHKAEMQCHRDPYAWECMAKCSEPLPCGHDCKRHCSMCTKSKSHETRCKERVSRELACGHTVHMSCYQDPETFSCPKPCETALSCGHICTGSCGACLRGKIHKICQSACEKTLHCGHGCKAKCSDLCPPCTLPCEWTCSHKKKCRKRCFEECEKCVERCQYNCAHSSCTKLCYEMCDRKPCEEKCTKTVKKCVHTCTASCGVTCICSEFCSVKNKYSSLYDKDTIYVKVSNCGCIIPQSLLDKHMQQPPKSRGELIKSCPDCSKSISSSNPRYTNILKQSRRDVVMKFATITGTDVEKTLKCQYLNGEILKLTAMGLDTREQEYLRKRIDPKSFASLHMTDKAVELLQYLLTMEQKLKAFPDAHLVIKPSKLRTVIIKDRKYTTTQFWDEVRNEIKRIDYYVQLETLRQNVGERFAEPLKDQLYVKCKEILCDDAPLDTKRKLAVRRVLQNLKA